MNEIENSFVNLDHIVKKVVFLRFDATVNWLDSRPYILVIHHQSPAIRLC